jgi:hypothetical protein
MKQKLHKPSAVFMALLLLFSTLSFSMDMHFCGDHLVDFSLFQKAEGCGMMSAVEKSPVDCAVVEADMDCCTDIQILVEGQDDFNGSFDQLSFSQQIFITSFIYSYVNLFEGFENSSPGDWQYASPPLIRDTRVLYQTFLI